MAKYSHFLNMYVRDLLQQYVRYGMTFDIWHTSEK